MPAVLPQLTGLLCPDARVYAESAEKFEPAGYTAVRSARAGQVHYQLLQQSE